MFSSSTRRVASNSKSKLLSSWSFTRTRLGKCFQHRYLSSSNVDDNKEKETSEFLSSLGYKDAELQKGMKDALKGVFGAKIAVSHLKSLGNEGLKSLSKSVQEELDKQNPNAFICTVHIKVPHHNFNFDIKLREGENFMECVTNGDGKEILAEYLECACGGNMSCSTCHVILDQESFSKLEKPCEAENDMLDLAYDFSETSRLGCQVTMTRDLDGMTVTIPSGVNNMWG